MRKILFCAVDVGGRICQYTKILEERYGTRVKCESFVKYAVSQSHFKSNYTRVYQFREKSSLAQWWLSLRHFLWALFRFDVIYIISGENILTHKLLAFELWSYRLFGKKIVMHFVGSDIRNTAHLIWQNFAHAGKTDEPEPAAQTSQQIHRCRLAEKYAHKILVSTPDLLSFFTEGKAEYIPVFLDVEAEGSASSGGEDVTVLFAPSHIHVKGADVVSPVLDKIAQREGVSLIDTTLMDTADKPDQQYKLTRYELLEYYKSAGVLIDQVIIGWYGLQAIEALAFGLLPVVRIDQTVESHLNEDCPMITFSDISSLEEAIIRAIEMKQKGEWDAARARTWVAENHSADASDQLGNLLAWIAGV